jgi:hypothetical protein
VSATEFQPHHPDAKGSQFTRPDREQARGNLARASEPTRLKPGRPSAVACTRQNGDGGGGQQTSASVASVDPTRMIIYNIHTSRQSEVELVRAQGPQQAGEPHGRITMRMIRDNSESTRV